MVCKHRGTCFFNPSWVLITTVCVCTTMTGKIMTVVLLLQYQTVVIFPFRVLPYTTTGQHSNQDQLWCVNIGEHMVFESISGSDYHAYVRTLISV